MSEENVEIVRRIMERWAEGDFTDAIPSDPNVTMVISRDYPEFGVFTGPDGMAEYMRRFLDQWEQWSAVLEEVTVVGDTVVAKHVQRGTFRATGIEAEAEGYFLFTFRGGKIIRLDTIMHEAEARAAVGLPD
jgi:ketosteroid isomerase-like protein